MKQYLLFAGMTYYPSGGWKDYVESFDSIEEAEARYRADYEDEYYNWYHVVDLHTYEIVKSSR
jgi:hypothetical protein